MNNNSKKSIGLIALVAVIFVILIVIAGKVIKQSPTTPSVTPTPSYHADATLQLQLTQLGATIGTTVIPSEIAVNVTSGTNHVRGAQFVLQYDPKYLRNVTIKPGPYLQHPSELSKKIDPVKGTISYAVAVAPGTQASTGKGAIALIDFQLAPNATGTNTTVSFVGKSIIISADTLANVMMSTTNVVVPLPKR